MVYVHCASRIFAFCILNFANCTLCINCKRWLTPPDKNKHFASCTCIVVFCIVFCICEFLYVCIDCKCWLTLPDKHKQFAHWACICVLLCFFFIPFFLFLYFCISTLTVNVGWLRLTNTNSLLTELDSCIKCRICFQQFLLYAEQPKVAMLIND